MRTASSRSSSSPVGHQVLRRLDERPLERAEPRERVDGRHHVEPERDPQRGLQRGQRDLAVALREVRVAHVRERARHLHRQVERAAHREQVDVDVAAVRAGRHGVRALVPGDRDAHDPEERAQRELDHALAALDRAGRQPRSSRTVAKTLTFSGPRGQLARQRAAAVPVGDHAVRDARGRLQDGDRQQVARHRARDVDRSGDHVRSVGAGRAVEGADDLDRVGEHVIRRDAVAGEERERVAALVLEQALVADRVDGDLGAGLDRRTGVSAAHGRRPHRTVAGVDGR